MTWERLNKDRTLIIFRVHCFFKSHTQTIDNVHMQCHYNNLFIKKMESVLEIPFKLDGFMNASLQIRPVLILCKAHWFPSFNFMTQKETCMFICAYMYILYHSRRTLSNIWINSLALQCKYGERENRLHLEMDGKCQTHQLL